MLGKTPDDQPLREACADAAWLSVSRDKASLDAFASQWAHTTAGKRAHREAGALALESAGKDEAPLRSLVASYEGTLAAEEALRRLTHADFMDARDAGDAASMERFLALHPDAAHRPMATNILNNRRFDETGLDDSVQAWNLFMETWPGHPRLEEARGRLADATYRESATPDALYAFALAWPDHAKRVEALEASLPLLITVSHRDSDLEVATRTLEDVDIQAPEEVEFSLWVVDQTVVEACGGALEPVWNDGQLRFPFGQCQVDGDPIRYVVRASMDEVRMDFDVWVRQARRDPTLDLALRFGPVAVLKAGCEQPADCAASRLDFDGEGRLLVAVQGAAGDEEVAWWPLAETGAVPQAPMEPAGTWRGPLASVSALAISASGSRLAIGFCSETLASLYLVDIAADRILGTRDGLCAQDMAFGPGDQALGVLETQALHVIDGQTGASRGEQVLEQSASLLAWSVEGLAWWGGPEETRGLSLWAEEELTPLASGSVGEHVPRVLQETSDGSRICLLSDGGYTCWDPSSGQRLRAADLGAVQVQAGAGKMFPVAMAPDLDMVAVGTSAGAVNLYDGRTAEHLGVLVGATGAITSLALSRDGARIAAVDGAGAIVLWSVR